jgi:hypothetical protein
MALRTAFFALVGLEMAKLSTAASLLTLSHALEGDIYAVMLIAPAVAAAVIMLYALYEAARGLASSRRPPSA